MEASQKTLTLLSFSMHQCSIHWAGAAWSDTEPQMWATMPSLGELCQYLKVFFPSRQAWVWSSSTAQHCCSGNRHLLNCQDCFGWGLWVRSSPEASSLANTIFTSVLLYAALNFLLLLVFYINWFYGPRCFLVLVIEQIYRHVLFSFVMPCLYIIYLMVYERLSQIWLFPHICPRLCCVSCSLHLCMLF